MNIQLDDAPVPGIWLGQEVMHLQEEVGVPARLGSSSALAGRWFVVLEN